jgi:hypothetical protein
LSQNNDAVLASLFYYSEPKPSRVPRIVLGVVSALFAWNYYATINGLVRRSAYAAFTPPASDADDLCKVAPASWRAVFITAADGVIFSAMETPLAPFTVAEKHTPTHTQNQSHQNPQQSTAHPCPPERVAAIKQAFRRFGLL